MPYMSAPRMALSGLALVPTLALAGPLDPPAGPVAATHKTLTQIEPRTPISSATTPGNSFSTYRITEPGSYYLTGDIHGVSGQHGIRVESENVVIDLGGFALVGVDGSGDAISVTSGSRNLTVRDGVITEWNDGIRGVSGGGARYERLTLHNNRGVGLVSGSSSVIIDCTASHSGEDGFELGLNCIMTRCAARDNTGTGIVVFGAGTVIDCLASTNGAHGISLGARSLARGNHCILNGIDAEGAGIYVPGQFSRVEGNSLVQNGRGLHVVGTRNLIAANSAALNGSNYTIGASNTAGPVTSDLSTASSWANISH